MVDAGLRAPEGAGARAGQVAAGAGDRRDSRRQRGARLGAPPYLWLVMADLATVRCGRRLRKRSRMRSRPGGCPRRERSAPGCTSVSHAPTECVLTWPTLTSTWQRSKAILGRSVVAPRRPTWTQDAYPPGPTTQRAQPPLCTPVDARSTLIEYPRAGHVPHLEIPN